MVRPIETFSLAIVFAALANSALGKTTAQICPVQSFSVAAETSDDADTACDVAVQTDTRLRSLGLELHEPVLIEVTPDLDVAQGVCVALYSTQQKKLQVLPMDCLEEQPGRASTFPEMAPDVLFESLIVHELVHAYVDQSSTGRFLPRIAHEYLAYAIQVGALPDEDRQRVLEKAAITEPVEIADINEALLHLSPLSFAAMAWLHFSGEGGDAAVVQKILNGDLLLNSLWE